MADLSVMSYLLPIFAFLLVFIVVYAVLHKTKVLGGNAPISLFVSFILAGFFVVQASMVEFIQFSSAWFAVLVIAVFFVMALIAFLPGKEPMGFLVEKSWFSWVILGLVIGIFIISSAYAFNWAINWDNLQRWIGSDWFGMVLLLLVAALVAWRIKD